MSVVGWNLNPQFWFIISVCNDSLGLGDGRIADNQITASSIALTRKASAVRLNATAKGWIPSSTDKSPYIEISFNSPVIISAVATKGVKEQLVRHWVTKYNLFYKKLGEGTLIQYQRNGQPMVSVSQVWSSQIMIFALGYSSH